MTRHLRGCAWSGALCSDHGCPECEIAAEGRGECEVCDELTGTPAYPDAQCQGGDDCLVCRECWRCMCKRPVCRECERCSEHGDSDACDHSWWDPELHSWTVAT